MMSLNYFSFYIKSFVMFINYFLSKISSVNHIVIYIILIIYILQQSILTIFFKELISYINMTLFGLFVLLIVGNFKTKYSNMIIYLVLLSILMIGYLVNINQIDNGGRNAFLLTIAVWGLLLVKFEHLNLYRLNKFVINLSFVVVLLSLVLYISGFQLSSDAIAKHQTILTGIFTNSNQAGLLFLLLFILIINTANKYSKSTILLFILLIFSILMTLSRASIIAMVIILFYYIVKHKKLFFYSIVLFMLFISFNVKVFDKLILKFTDQGTSNRTEIWSTVVSNRTESMSDFLVGTGSNTTYFIMDGGRLSAHSSIINAFGDFGFIYLCLLFIVVIYFIFTISNNKLLLFSFLAIIFNGLFETTLFAGNHLAWFTILFLYSISLKIKKDRYAHINNSI